LRGKISSFEAGLELNKQKEAIRVPKQIKFGTKQARTTLKVPKSKF
jgi:hypothetical protein